MTIENLRKKIGDFAKDISINLSKVLSEDGSPDLSKNQAQGIALACAYATRNAEIAEALLAENILSDAEIKAAKSAASIMAMNNVYYRFVHLVNDSDINKLPANLRMQVIVNSGIAKLDFELYSLAVSAINGCGMCMESHVHEVTKNGASKLAAQSAIRIAAVINATAQALAIQ